jgi:integrase
MSIECSIRADGTKRYKVRWKEHGASRAKSFDKERDAIRFDGDIKRRLALGDDLTPRGTQRLDAFTQRWIDTHMKVALTTATQDVYATQLDLRILPALGHLRLRDIRPSSIDEFVAAMRRKGVGDPTVVKTLTVLQSILQRAVRDEEIATNPVRAVRKPAQRREREPIMVAPEKVEVIRQGLLAEDRMRDATLVSLLAYAGLRPESEAITLTWEQVGKRTIFIPRGRKRGGRDRHVRLLAGLAQDLGEWRLASGTRTGLVFPASDGAWKGHDWDNWRDRIFRPQAHVAGLPADVRPRDLRSSFATLLIHEGRTIVEVARQLGHSASTCVKDYAGVFEEFDPAQRVTADEAIAAARAATADVARSAER